MTTRARTQPKPKMTAGRPSVRAGREETTLADLKEPKSRINGDIPQVLHRRVKVYAAEKGITMTEILSIALSEYLSKYDNK